MHILYVGPFALRTGYSQAAHDYMLALHRAGVSIEIQPTEPCHTDDLDERYHELFTLTRGHPDHEWAKRPTHVIVHAVPGALPELAAEFRFEDRPLIAITTWETSHLEEELTKAILEAYDVVVVPSNFCAEAFNRWPNEGNIVVIPHCFSPDHWPAHVGQVGFASPGSVVEINSVNDLVSDQHYRTIPSPYVFYSILGWNDRKNPIGLLKAYYATFSSADDVVLRLKVSDINVADVNALQGALGYPREEIPKVEIVTKYMDHDELVRFHLLGDCFVTAARGEGWNLPAFEAMILGKPVIATGFGGHEQFATWGEYFPVNYTKTPAVVPPQVSGKTTEIAGLRVRAVHHTAPSGITARQYWAEPDLGHLGFTMREVFEQQTRADQVGEDLERLFGYKTVGYALATLLEETQP